MNVLAAEDVMDAQQESIPTKEACALTALGAERISSGLGAGAPAQEAALPALALAITTSPLAAHT